MMSEPPNFEDFYKSLHKNKTRVLHFICKEIDGISKTFLTFDEVVAGVGLTMSQVSTEVNKLGKDRMVIKEEIKNHSRNGSHKRIRLTERGYSFREFLLKKITNHEKNKD